jgi:hypothetical protein
MPDLDLIKQGEQGVRYPRGRFARGRSGDPAGRPTAAGDGVRDRTPPMLDQPTKRLVAHLTRGWCGVSLRARTIRVAAEVMQ